MVVPMTAVNNPSRKEPISAPTEAAAEATAWPAEPAGVKRACQLLLVGAICWGAVVLSPIGLVLMWLGLRRLNQLRREAAPVLPNSIIVLAVWAMVTAGANMIAWSLDTWAHDAHVVQVFLNGFGRLWDGGYYIDYNTRFLGGIGQSAEKSFQLMSVLMIFPIQLAASYGFLRLKRWGLQMMIATSWMYAALYLGYIAENFIDFPSRAGAGLYGVTGWWFDQLFYMTPFLLLPWLYALDWRYWRRDLGP
jgi:hypothetical protein